MSIKSLVSRKTKNVIKYVLSTNKHTYDCYKGKKKVIVCLGADYGNLGDVAITFAQIEFLKKCFPDCVVFEFPISSTYTDMKSLKSIIEKDDLITLIGGGNTSERYADIEECREFIVNRFKRNTIVSFPQSVELTTASDKFISDMKRTYLTRNNIYFIAREQYSFDSYKNALPGVKVNLFPDIVLSYDVPKSSVKRDIITVSFRQDKERLLTDEQAKEIYDELSCYGLRVETKDTQITQEMVFDIETRRRLLTEHVLQYQKSRLVVTDRLHGMILAYITKTPCIVFSGDNTKIKGCYEWIKSSRSMFYFDLYDRKELSKALTEIMSYPYRFDDVCVSFDELKNYLINICS